MANKIILGKPQADATLYKSVDGNYWRRTTTARKESSTMSFDDVRALCIAKGLYTRGTSEEYEALQYLVETWEEGDTITTEMLQIVAEDILEHSTTEYGIESLMYELSRSCVRRFYTVAEH